MLVLLSALAGALAPKYDCGGCLTLQSVGTAHCGALGACHLADAALSGCNAVCGAEEGAGEEGLVAPPPPSARVQLRVSQGLGTRPYGTLRVSVITYAENPPPVPFDYSAVFKYKWEKYALHSSLKAVEPGKHTPLNLGGNTTASLWLPAQGAGVAGVLIADPCVRLASIASLVDCEYAESFHTSIRTPALLNAFMGHPDADYWGVLGDNWYDRTGILSEKIYEKIALRTLAKPALAVPGNHDYWILSAPALGTVLDQYGNGHMQWHAMDTLAARHLAAGSHEPPFDFSVDPSKGHTVLGGNLPAPDNSFFYHQLGNVGLIGLSGAYSVGEIRPRLEEACAWLPRQFGLRLAVLLGHWDHGDAGATDLTDMPGLYDLAKSMDGCRELDAAGALKFVMGHSHCNEPHPHGNVGEGFMVGGFGMGGCGNYGVPVLDTTEDRARFWYFSVATASSARFNETDHYDEVHDCVSASGWRNCTHLAELWLDEPLNITCPTCPRGA